MDKFEREIAERNIISVIKYCNLSNEQFNGLIKMYSELIRLDDNQQNTQEEK